MQGEISISLKQIMESFIRLIDNTFISHIYCGQIIKKHKVSSKHPTLWSCGMIQPP